jgi:hypothetical protein
MKYRLKNYLDNIKRIYRIICEHRSVEEIRTDYYQHKWITKTELILLFEFEKLELIRLYKEKENEYNTLISGFSTHSFSNYAALERKMQGLLTNR